MSTGAGKPRVLDVGQCDFDHGNISRVLSSRFGAEVERCHFADEALRAVENKTYHLVLVNRVFDRDAYEGLKLIERLGLGGANGLDFPDHRPPVMLVSNFPDAQAAAVKAGAVQGFGKAALETEETIRILGKYLCG